MGRVDWVIKRRVSQIKTMTNLIWRWHTYYCGQSIIWYCCNLLTVFSTCTAQYRDHSGHAFIQRETTLHGNVGSHWLSLEPIPRLIPAVSCLFIQLSKWPPFYSQNFQLHFLGRKFECHDLNSVQYIQRDWVNTLRPRQNGRHFADDTFKCIFLNETFRISIKISLKFVPKDPINNIPALVQIMTWRRSGDKPLSEPMMVSLPTHICVTQPQWVNQMWPLVQEMVWCRESEMPLPDQWWICLLIHICVPALTELNQHKTVHQRS